MLRKELIRRTRKNLNDEQNTLFTQDDIASFINEGIERVIQIIPELDVMDTLTTDEESPQFFPKSYHHLLSVYATSRCSSKDQRHYEASTLMNEFETKLQQLFTQIQNGEVILTDEFGYPLIGEREPEYVVNRYFHPIPRKE